MGAAARAAGELCGRAGSAVRDASGVRRLEGGGAVGGGARRASASRAEKKLALFFVLFLF